MARMPQIPQPDISNRPDSHVGLAPLPDIEGAVRPAQEGAKMAAGVGGQLQDLQDQRDAKLAKVQAVLDDTTAINERGQHANKLSQMSAQLQKQFIDDPQKAIGAFNEASTSMTDDAAKSPTLTAGASQKLTPMLAQANNEERARLENWAIGRGVQNAKNQLEGLQYTATHGLEKFTSAQAAINYAHYTLTKAATPGGPTLAKLQQQLTPDGKASARDFIKDVVNSWVSQRSATSPEAALDVRAELRNPQSQLRGYMDADDIAKATHGAEQTFTGWQKRMAFDSIASAHNTFDGLGRALDANDPGFPAAATAKRQELLAQMDAGEKKIAVWRQKITDMATVDASGKKTADPKLLAQADATEKKLQAWGTSMLGSLDHLQTAYRLQSGLEGEGKIDEKVRGDLFRQQAKLFTTGQKSFNLHYDAALKLRQDNIEAFVAGQIPASSYNLVESSLRDALPKADEVAGGKVGGWWSRHFTAAGARQAGNVKINEAFAGGLKAAPPEMKNDAQEEYARQAHAAETSGANFDNEAAEQMAKLAIKKATDDWAEARGTK